MPVPEHRVDKEPVLAVDLHRGAGRTGRPPRRVGGRATGRRARTSPPDFEREDRRQHGEVLPLPNPPEALPLRGQSRRAWQRWQVRAARRERLVEAVRAVNSLAQPRVSNYGDTLYVSHMVGANRAQRSALSQMERRVAAYGDRPAGLTPEGALREFCHMKDVRSRATSWTIRPLQAQGREGDPQDRPGGEPPAAQRGAIPPRTSHAHRAHGRRAGAGQT